MKIRERAADGCQWYYSNIEAAVSREQARMEDAAREAATYHGFEDTYTGALFKVGTSVRVLRIAFALELAGCARWLEGKIRP